MELARATRSASFVVLLGSLAPHVMPGELLTEPSPFLRALEPSSVAWLVSLEAARADAHAERPLFVLLGPSRLGDCSRPETAILGSDAVQIVLARAYTAVAIDCDERPDLCDVYTAAVARLQPELERDGRALWIAATPEGWPFAGGAFASDARVAAGLAGLLDSHAQSYAQERADTRLRAGALAAELRQAQASPGALRPLGRDVVVRALKGVRDAAGPSARLDAPRYGALRLLLAEAERDAGTRRVLARTLDAVAAERVPACRGTTAEEAQRLRALVLGYALDGTTSWRAAAEAAAARLVARQDPAGGLTHAEGDERVFALDNGLALGALALSGAKLQRPADVAAARSIAVAVLARLRPLRTLQRFAVAEARRGSALLADHAFLAEGLLDLYDATSQSRWRDEALALVDAALVRFADPAGGLFDSDADLVARPRNAFDGDQPAASGVMAGVLLRVATATGQTRYADLARGTVTSFLGDLQRAPRGVETLAAVAREWTGGSAAAAPAPDVGEAKGPVQGALALSTTQVHAGGRLIARIALTIADGYSINAHQPGSRELYGLSVSAVGDGLRAAVPIYPPAANVPRRFSKETILGHVGRALVELPLIVSASASAGELHVRVRVGFQLCTERGCQSPDSLVLDVPVQVVR